MKTDKKLGIDITHLLFIAIQVVCLSFTCGSAYAILPKAQAQIQAFEADFSQGLNNSIGSVLDEHTASATATQNLQPRNSILNASADVSTLNELKLTAAIDASTTSQSSPSGGLSATASYVLTTAAEFRDVIHVTASSSYTNTSAHLVFKLTGGPLTANVPGAGSVAVTGGEVGFSIDSQAKVGDTGSTNDGIGKFDGTEQTYEVVFPVDLSGATHEAPEVVFQALLSLSSSISTFYVASSSANYTSAGLVFQEAFVTDNQGNRLSGININGDSGYLYAGERISPKGRYGAKDRAKGISFEADIDEDDRSEDDSKDDDNSDDTSSDQEDETDFSLKFEDSRFNGVGSIANGVGPMTFGPEQKKSISFKRKGKPTIVLSLTLKKKKNDYEIVGKIRKKGMPGTVSFTAKKKKSSKQ